MQSGVPVCIVQGSSIMHMIMQVQIAVMMILMLCIMGGSSATEGQPRSILMGGDKTVTCSQVCILGSSTFQMLGGSARNYSVDGAEFRDQKAFQDCLEGKSLDYLVNKGTATLEYQDRAYPTEVFPYPICKGDILGGVDYVCTSRCLGNGDSRVITGRNSSPTGTPRMCVNGQVSVPVLEPYKNRVYPANFCKRYDAYAVCASEVALSYGGKKC